MVKQNPNDVLRQMKKDTIDINMQTKNINNELYSQDKKLDRMNNQLDDIHSINTKNQVIANDLTSKKGLLKMLICCGGSNKKNKNIQQKNEKYPMNNLKTNMYKPGS